MSILTASGSSIWFLTMMPHDPRCNAVFNYIDGKCVYAIQFTTLPQITCQTQVVPNMPGQQYFACYYDPNAAQITGSTR